MTKTGSKTEPLKYWAFLSYAHRDGTTASTEAGPLYAAIVRALAGERRLVPPEQECKALRDELAAPPAFAPRQ